MHDTAPVIRLRERHFRDLAKRAGLTTDSAIATRLGLQQSTVMRMLNGDIRPGEKTIAAMLAAFPGTKFEDLFEVTEEKVAASESAA
jgi:transcriptional regulator with XRE-family HTH domain